MFAEYYYSLIKKKVIMKINRIVIASLITGMLAVSCNSAEESTEVENQEETSISETVEVEEEPATETEAVELEDKTYTVEDFVAVYNGNKEGVKGQTVTIEGYYMNSNKQKDANSDDAFEYNVTLYKDETFGRKEAQVFFIMKTGDADQFKGIKQKDKITVTGVISGEDFFSAPKLNEGVIVK